MLIASPAYPKRSYIDSELTILSQESAQRSTKKMTALQTQMLMTFFVAHSSAFLHCFLRCRTQKNDAYLQQISDMPDY